MIEYDDKVYGTPKMCGTPYDLMNEAIVRGERIRYCPDCRAMKGKFKNCMRCKKKFQPGCKITRMCYNCFKYAGTQDEEFEYLATPTGEY